VFWEGSWIWMVAAAATASPAYELRDNGNAWRLSFALPHSLRERAVARCIRPSSWWLRAYS